MNTKTLSTIIIILLLSSCTRGPKNPGTGINYFKGNFDKAMVEAANQNKPIFIYGYTDWCGYCTRMNKTTFMEKEVCDYMNSNYINLSYDMEKGEGTYIRNKYGLNSYPAFVAVNKEGRIINIGFGYMKVSDFMNLVKVSVISN